MKKETRVTHQRKVKLPDGNEALIPPIYRSVKFTHPSIEASLSPDVRHKGFEYTRDANPTTRQLELLSADLQGRGDGVCVASGMAAVWLSLLGNLNTGDRLVFFIESYRPTRTLLRTVLPRFGINSSMLGVHEYDNLARVFAQQDTKLLIFEAPTNPMLQVPDIEGIVALAQKHGVTTVLDNTFGGLHNHGQFEIDYYVHSLTKYAGGHGDVMGGVVIADEKRIKTLHALATSMGSTMDPGAAYLILRGLRTYHLRYERHSSSALSVAEYLAANPSVEKVFYPGLENDVGHSLANKQMDGCGAVLAFNLNADKKETWAFIDALELFATTSSVGSTESLVAPVKLYFASDLDEQELERAEIKDSSVRFSVGLEHPDDLIRDLEGAFTKVFG
ncbi:MAG: PLP-dependent transferase [Gammaproteobacteria bacterium]